MSENFWKKIDQVIGLFPLAAIFAMIVVSANLEIKDLDLWLHLAMGKFITLHRYVPDIDVLSCTIQGAPWVNHEWLFQLIVYNIYRLWGPDGLINMQVVVVSSTMLLLLCLGYDKNRQLLTTVILFLVYMVFQQRFTIRPDLFSLLFFAVYIFILSLHIDKKWAAPVLFTVQVLWSNVHGFFFFGPMFVFIGIVCEWVRRHIPLPYEWNESGRLNDQEYGRLKKILFIVLLACLINPQFVKGAWYPAGVFFSLSGENRIFFDHIQELKRPIAQGTLLSRSHYLYYKIIIFLSFVSFVFNRRRIDISALVFWLVFLLFSLMAVRNTAFFAFAAYLVFITNLLNINIEDIVPLRFTAKKFQYLTGIFLKILFLVWIYAYYQAISVRSYYDFERYELKSDFGGISQRSYPDKAVDFLVENNVKGNFFNDFNSGAYLLGRTYPDIKVFIDGRTEVYGGEFFRKYQEVWEHGNTELFEKAVDKFGLTGALLNSSRQFIPKKFLNYLYNHKDWHVVYFGFDGVIFLKDAPVNRELIDRFEIDLTQWQAPKIDLYKLGTLRVKPYQSYYRAYTLESLSLTGLALDELEQAIRADPFYAEAHDLAGKIYAEKKEHQKAFEHFRISVTALPGSKEKRHNLALAYYDLGQYAGAVHQYEIITKMWPDDPMGYYLLAKAFIADGQFTQGQGAITRVLALSPKNAKDIMELGDLMMEQEAYVQARKAYEQALIADENAEGIHKKLGRAYAKIGDPQRAKEEFQKALRIDPDDAEAQQAIGDLP